MLVIRVQEMRDIDKRAIEDYKIPGIVLMENAALAVLGFMKRPLRLIKMIVYLYRLGPATTVETAMP